MPCRELPDQGGIKVPPVLQEYMGGVRFIAFVKAPEKPKKGPAPPQCVPTPARLESSTVASSS